MTKTLQFLDILQHLAAKHGNHKAAERC
jgi:hypothetical protein